MEKIKINDITPGDKIRAEINHYEFEAIEYTAQYIGQSPLSNLDITYYLMERPYVPKYGDVIGKPEDVGVRAVHIPAHEGDGYPWLAVDELGSGGWEANTWALDRLAEGWVHIEKPEGV